MAPDARPAAVMARDARRVGRRAFLKATVAGLALPSLATASSPRVRSISCLGDSITDTGFFPDAYPHWLKAWFPRVPIVAEGESGDTTAQILERCQHAGIYTWRSLAKYSPALARPARPSQYTFVLAGTNDVRLQETTALEIIANLIRIYQYLLRRKSTPCPITILPWAGAETFRPDREHVRLVVNDWIRRQTYPLIPIDAESTMGNGRTPPALKPAYDDGDGVHPVGDGAKVLAALAARALKAGPAVELVTKR